jgi:hypothetical protein
MFHCYTRSEHQKYISHKISLNKCSKFLLLSLKSFVAEKRYMAMQKLFIKRKKNIEKWTGG